MNKFDLELERKNLYRKGAPITITADYLFNEMDEAASYFEDVVKNGYFVEEDDVPDFDKNTPEQDHIDYISAKGSALGKLALLKDLCKMMYPDMLESISEHFKAAFNRIQSVPEPESAITEMKNAFQ